MKLTTIPTKEILHSIATIRRLGHFLRRPGGDAQVVESDDQIVREGRA